MIIRDQRPTHARTPGGSTLEILVLADEDGAALVDEHGCMILA